MKTIQCEAFETRDGKRYLLREEAERHELRLSNLVIIDDVMAALGKPVSGDGYKQREARLCEAVATGIIRAFAKAVPTQAGYCERVLEQGAFACRHGMVGRVISDCDSDFWRAWGRIGCIDDKYREWEQPYYAIHGGKMVEQAP